MLVFTKMCICENLDFIFQIYAFYAILLLTCVDRYLFQSYLNVFKLENTIF